MRCLPKNNGNPALNRALVGAVCSLALLASPAAWAAAPANDNFANAQIIMGEKGSVKGTNVSATLEAGEPVHASVPNGASVWYRWTAPRDGVVSFDTVGSNFDTVLGVYTGNSLASLSCVTGNDDFDPTVFGASAVKFTAAAGVVYQIAVAGYAGATGSIVLNWAYSSGGTFEFTTPLYITSERESFGTVSLTVAPSIPTLLTVTRLFGTSGRVQVKYTVTNDFYTNLNITSYYATVTIVTNPGSMPGFGFSNTFSTNILIQNFFKGGS